MKTLNTILLAVGVMMGTTGLHAQTAVANIPFDFTVATANLPAGEYMVKCATSTCSTIQLVNHETRQSVMVLVRDKNAPKDNDGATGKITFHRYGDQYYFAGLWTPNGPRGDVAPSRLERELRAGSDLTILASVNIPLTTVR